MKRLMNMMGALALLVALPACGGDGPVNSGGSHVPGHVPGTPHQPQMPDEAAPADGEVDSVASIVALKTVTGAALVYDSLAKTATAGIKLGIIPDASLPAIEDLNQQATAALSFGYTATSATERGRAVHTLQGILLRLRALVK